MKISEAFEGKDSSLRQVFESTTIEAQIDAIMKDSEVVILMAGSAIARNKDNPEWLRYALNDIYARGCNDGAYEQRVLMELNK